MLGLIATRSIDTPVEGIKPLVENAEQRIRNGLAAYKWLREGRRRRQPLRVPAALEKLDARPRLCASSEAHPARYRKRDGHADSRSGACRRFLTYRFCFGRSASWWRSASISSLCLAPPSISPAGDAAESHGFCGSPCSACRCPGSRPNLAGSSRNMDASPGSSTACCRHSSACRTFRRRMCCCSLLGFVAVLHCARARSISF